MEKIIAQGYIFNTHKTVDTDHRRIKTCGYGNNKSLKGQSIMIQPGSEAAPVLITVEKALMTVTLNRPRAINSLDLEMVRIIRHAMDRAASDDNIRLILLRGEGEKGFCAGADVKAVVKALEEDRKADAMQFFTEEYILDLAIHRFSKPVIALAHGITMGGGLGLTAGADLVIATETTRMAMPETRIGFFPDVGATGWLFSKCPEGYPEYFALTGEEAVGSEAVRLGLCDELVLSKNLATVEDALKRLAADLDLKKTLATNQIRTHLAVDFEKIPALEDTSTDRWVKKMFSGRTDTMDIISNLTRSTHNREQCQAVLDRLAERSPTATVLTLKLLRENQNRPLEAVFNLEIQACEAIISHPDYREGVRARLIDKDNIPKWQPAMLAEARPLI